MASDFESGTRKTIDISVKAEKVTADVLKAAFQEFMSGKAEKKGRMTYKQLQDKSPSKLDSIEVSDRNIGDFLNTARKYDVDFALKKDKSTEPPTYHVFFSAAKTADFKRAFSEYVGKGQCKTKQRGQFTREQMNRQAQKIAGRPRKHKHREKSRENRR
ncbi:MAG: PcfB family protein [Alistipes sp.]|nr:PcfB family protein [Alistipes sp.]